MVDNHPLYKNVLTFFILFCLFLNIFISTMISAQIKDHERSFIDSAYSTDYYNCDDWYDGSFSGWWGEDQNHPVGYIRGNLNQGRRSTLGSFWGEWNRSSDNTYGVLIGRFRLNLLFGKMQVAGEDKFYFFVGRFNANDSHFEARIFSLKMGFIYIFGEHDESFLPGLTGPYDVGLKLVHLIDKNRFEEFTPEDPDDFREVMVQLWYPIDKDSYVPRSDYMDYATFSWLMGRSPVPLITIPKSAYKYVRPHGRIEAPISQKEDLFPVIIFSPGYDGVYQIYTSLIEDIVSYGFIVASINHPYVSGFTVFPDGRKIGVAPDWPGELAIRSVVEDAKFVLNIISEFNDSESAFLGRFDLSRIGMYGHSFGGASTTICCYEDSRFIAGCALDGVFYHDYVSGGFDKPFLMMLTEERFDVDQSVYQMWDNLHGDAYKVGINGSTHYGFTDVGILLSHFVPLISPSLLGFGTIEPKRHVNITKSFVLEFFKVYLRGEPIENILELVSDYQEVRFDYK